MRKARPELAQYAWTPDGYVLADLIDITVWAATGKVQAPYLRPAQRIEAHREQQDRFEALEAQHERNRQREAQRVATDT